MPGVRGTSREAELAGRRRRVLRTEIATGGGSAIIGAVFLAGSHTMREMSIFLFGWAGGCAVHLAQTVITGRLAHRRDRKRESRDAED